MPTKKEHCAVCGTELLQDEEREYKSPLTVHLVCKEHREYHAIRFIEIVQKRLRIISEYPDNMKKCEICDTPLSISEIDAIEITDNLIICIKHMEARKWINAILAKQWFEFKKDFPAANYDNVDDKMIFYKWKRNKTLPPL